GALRAPHGRRLERRATVRGQRVHHVVRARRAAVPHHPHADTGRGADRPRHRRGRAALRRVRRADLAARRMSVETTPIASGFVARFGGHTLPAALGPDSDQVVLFSETELEGFEPASGYWRRTVPRSQVEWLVLIRTVGAFGGEP